MKVRKVADPLALVVVTAIERPGLPGSEYANALPLRRATTFAYLNVARSDGLLRFERGRKGAQLWYPTRRALDRFPFASRRSPEEIADETIVGPSISLPDEVES